MLTDVISTVVTSALVATVAGAAITEWIQNRKRKSSARFAALSAAIGLEGYGIECAERIAAHDLAVSSGGHAGSFVGSLPDLPDLPELSIVAGFVRRRKAVLIDRLMALPQQKRQADQYVAFWWDVTADIDDTRDKAAVETGHIGLHAIVLANELRAEFGWAARELKFGDFNVKDALEERADALNRQ